MILNRTLLILFAIVGTLPPLVFRLINWYQGNTLGNWFQLAGTILSSVLTTVSISYGVVKVLIWLQAKFPWKEGIIKRLLLEISLTTFTACGLITLLTLLFHFVAPKENLQTSLFNNLVVAIILNLILVAITEGIFFFRQWKHAAVEAEVYKKEQIRAQFENLKNQVNPHFLFNNLNTLSSLIDEDKEVSQAFLDDLSTVYRYVLEHKDEELVSLKTELDFFHSYAQLLKKRHGDRLLFVLNIDSESEQKGIPPMALQMLIENAVKHNMATRKKPLKVEIFTQDNYLVVRNNLQRRKDVISTGVGLNNISKRYEYLANRNIIIDERLTSFEVRLPILELAKTH